MVPAPRKAVKEHQNSHKGTYQLTSFVGWLGTIFNCFSNLRMQVGLSCWELWSLATYCVTGNWFVLFGKTFISSGNNLKWFCSPCCSKNRPFIWHFLLGGISEHFHPAFPFYPHTILSWDKEIQSMYHPQSRTDLDFSGGQTCFQRKLALTWPRKERPRRAPKSLVKTPTRLRLFTNAKMLFAISLRTWRDFPGAAAVWEENQADETPAVFYYARH